MPKQAKKTQKTQKTPKTQQTQKARNTQEAGRGRTGENLARGDEVVWNTHGTTTEGSVERKITRRTRAAGRTVNASPEDPQYEVRSAASGRSAVHKPSALHKPSAPPGKRSR